MIDFDSHFDFYRDPFNCIVDFNEASLNKFVKDRKF